MPRIDPQQLLSCLSVLLSPEGGILSSNEVQRLANLMTKFSKKLVSKCVYIQILKSTESTLLGSFMGEGGWDLVHLWLQDAYLNKNWALVIELLELLLMTPVDVERLKTNNLPKVVKCLSKREDLKDVQQLASLLVQMWLKIVKEETKPMLQNKIESILANDISLQKMNIIESLKSSDPVINENVTGVTTKNEIDSECNITEIDSFTKEKNCYQLTMKDGNQVLQKLPSTDVDDKIKSSDESDEKEKKKDSSSEKSRSSSSSSKHHKKSKSSSSSKDRTSNSKSSSTSKSSSSSKDKHRDKDKSSSSSKLSDSSNKDKHKDKSKKDKERSDKHRSNGEIKKSGSSGSHKDKERRESKEKRAEKEKEKQAEKDKDTLSKLQSQQNIQKLGRIPKKGQEESSDDKKNADEVKKTSSMSIEVRKSGEERPKTVKIFNSKMRSTGLLEEAKPPPPRSAVNKKVPPTIPSNLPLKRSSPVREAIPPPEKRTKLDIPERPGSIKLIPPKPKRWVPCSCQKGLLLISGLEMEP